MGKEQQPKGLQRTLQEAEEAIERHPFRVGSALLSFAAAIIVFVIWVSL